MFRLLPHLHLHIGLIAWGLLRSAANFADLPMPPALQGLIFLGAAAAYTLDRVSPFSCEDLLNAPQRADLLRQHRRLLRGWLLLLFAGIAACLPFLPPARLFWTLLLLATGMAYTIPLLPGNRRLQDFPALKLPLLLTCWTAIPLFLPGWTGHPHAAAWLLYRALWILPNLLACEWRDRQGDQLARRPNALRCWTPARLRWTQRLLLAAALTLGASLGLRADLLGPLLLLLLLECGRHSPQRPDCGAWIDLPFLLPALLPG